MHTSPAKGLDVPVRRCGARVSITLQRVADPSISRATAPVVRVATDDDLPGILGVYRACRLVDPTYPAGAGRSARADLAEWFFRKRLASCLVVESPTAEIVGVAGLRAAGPPTAARIDRRLHWMESCRLAVHPDHRGGAASRALTAARMRAASELGADRLWLRCVPGSPAHGLYLRVGWTFLAGGRIEVLGAEPIRAVLLQRPVTHVPAARRG